MKKGALAFICVSIVVIGIGVGGTLIASSADDVITDPTTGCALCHDQQPDPSTPAPPVYAMPSGKTCTLCHGAPGGTGGLTHAQILSISHDLYKDPTAINDQARCAQCHKASTAQVPMSVSKPIVTTADMPDPRVSQGFTMTGTLTASNGVVLAGEKVDLQRYVNPSTAGCAQCHSAGLPSGWSTVGEASTDQFGTYSFTHSEHAPAVYQYRILYAGTSSTKAAQSDGFSVTVVSNKQYALEEVRDAQRYVSAIKNPEVIFKDATTQKALINKLSALDKTVTKENYVDAISKVQGDLLPKVDGVSPVTWMKPGTTEQVALNAKLTTLLTDLKELQSP